MIEFNVRRIDPAMVLNALARHVPKNALLVLEGGSPSGNLASFLEPFSAEPPDSVIRGTTWPRQPTYVIPRATDALQLLATFTDSYAGPELCDHLNIVVEGKLIVEWHDAFTASFYVTRDFGEIATQRLAKELGCPPSHVHEPE